MLISSILWVVWTRPILNTVRTIDCLHKTRQRTSSVAATACSRAATKSESTQQQRQCEMRCVDQPAPPSTVMRASTVSALHWHNHKHKRVHGHILPSNVRSTWQRTRPASSNIMFTIKSTVFPICLINNNDKNNNNTYHFHVSVILAVFRLVCFSSTQSRPRNSH